MRVFDKMGVEQGVIVDNYGLGAQNNKDQNPYKRLPLSACILHPEGK